MEDIDDHILMEWKKEVAKEKYIQNLKAKIKKLAQSNTTTPEVTNKDENH